MAVLKIVPGSKTLCDDLLGAAILSILLEAVTKGDHDAISIKSLSNDTVSSPKEVADTLQGLIANGLIRIPDDAETGSLSSFIPRSITIEIAPIQNSIPGFAQEPLRDRTDLGEEIISAGGFQYRARVEYYDHDTDPAVTLRIHQVDDDLNDIRVLVEKDDFMSKADAWAWWDEYRIGLEHPVIVWLESEIEKLRAVLIADAPEGEDPVSLTGFWVDEETFNLLCEAIPVCTGVGETETDEGTKEFVYKFVPVKECEVRFVPDGAEGTADDPLPMYVRFPGLDRTADDERIEGRFAGLEVEEVGAVEEPDPEEKEEETAPEDAPAKGKKSKTEDPSE